MGYMEMKDRIAQRMKVLGITQEGLAERVGLSQVAVHKILKGGKTRKILKLAAALECSPEWLENGTPPQHVIDHGGNTNNVYVLGRANSTMPLIGWVQAGAWCESPDQFAPGDAEKWLPRPPNAGPRSYALRVQNDSMTSPYPGQRTYPEGTIIYVDPDKPVHNGARVVARAGGEYTFKSYVEDTGRKYLRPLNPAYPTIDITEDVHICGVVIGSYLPE